MRSSASEGFVASGGYRLVSEGASEMALEANPRYWAGAPAIRTITLVTGLGGGSPVDRFEAGDIDYVSLDGADARWIAYDATLGPRLLRRPSDVDRLLRLRHDRAAVRRRSRPPGVRRRRRLAADRAPGRRRSGRRRDLDGPARHPRSERRATSLPAHDPEAARALLAEAGYRTGSGFPRVTLVTGGSPYDEAIVAELERELGIRIDQETMDFDAYFDRLDTDPPQMWFLSWVGRLSGPQRLPGRAAPARIRSTTTGTGLAGVRRGHRGGRRRPRIRPPSDAAYDRAEDIVQRDVPVIPMSYGTGWALAKAGLLGAGQNGLGSMRLAGLAWQAP